MKKLISIGVVALLALGVSVLSYADDMSTTKNLGVHVGVVGVFGFEVWDTELDMYLDDMTPGGASLGDIHIYATSNHSTPWFINAGSSGLSGETQIDPDTLPVLISTFDGGAGLTGTIVTDLGLTSMVQPIYSAGSGEYPCAGLQIDCVFAVKSTTETKEDLYSGTIVLTMTE